MISAFFAAFSGWFTILFLVMLGLSTRSKKGVAVLDMFIGSLIFGFLCAIPTFYGVYVLLEKL